jgi:hypothetical protein
MKIIKFWGCGCVTLFYKSDHKVQRSRAALSGFGVRIRRCVGCKFAKEIIDEILAEERAVKAAMLMEAAYRLQAQGTPEKKLDIYG